MAVDAFFEPTDCLFMVVQIGGNPRVHPRHPNVWQGTNMGANVRSIFVSYEVAERLGSVDIYFRVKRYVNRP